MIERLLAADAALERDDLDLAERLFAQVAEADPRNAIAVVGLGQVAARRGDRAAAQEQFRRALEIDPDDAAATRLVAEAAATEPAPVPEPAAEAELPAVRAAAPAPHERRPSLLRRILGWFGLG